MNAARMPLFLAEVADKEPSLLTLWVIALMLSGAAFCVAYWRRWAVLVPLALAAIWAAAVSSELRDPNVGPAIVEELGRTYVVQGMVTMSLPFLAGLLGFLRFRPNAA
jgi:hypothetical protein